MEDNMISLDELKVILRDSKSISTLDIIGNPIGPNLTSDAFAGSDKMLYLYMAQCSLQHIERGAFRAMTKLKTLRLHHNKLTSAPDLTGLTVVARINLENNQIKDLSPLGNSKIKHVLTLALKGNQMEQIPANVFQNLPVTLSLDLSFNKLTSIPNEAFSGCKDLTQLMLNFNFISQINNRTFAGLKNLRILTLINNNLTFIPEYTFADTQLQALFLHGNKIKHIDGNAFRGLSNLQSMTLFDNPLSLLPVKIFDGMTSHVTFECAPSASFHVTLYDDQISYKEDLQYSGFICTRCHPGDHKCYNCTFCMSGTYSDRDENCLNCPAGGFYQDEMGQLGCKNCSTGTRSNETAGYRACRCLHNFYRLYRFGPCTACPDYGINCENDAGILAPNYFWKWSNKTMEYYTNFVDNIHKFGPEYNKSFSIFQGPLPQPLKCPYPGSCKGGISSACNKGYQGTLCATCSYNHYLRFNSCLQCPSMFLTIISCILVILVFVFLFLMVLWGDSTRTENDNTRTVADVIMSCSKIVIGFYQVVAGIFSALVRVQWPVILISMGKYLKFAEGNILQFAPLSCIDHVLRLDPFLQFVLAIGINILIVSLILLYLFLKKRYIMNRMDILPSQKLDKISSLKKSCYRNIFLFLLLSYPMTSKKIIHILPLPGVCVDMCFNKNGSECISLLKADYSIHCFTARHNVFWHIAAAFALYPVAFPLLLLIPIYKYRKSNPDKEEIAFGIRVFFENYKPKYWFWEIVEMYRKLVLISVILLVGSESRSQIGFAVITASVSGIAYTIFRPIKSKFEDRLQTFVIWIIFFNVCLGAIYSQPDVSRNPGKNDSIFVNVLFVVLNSAVLLLAVGNGLLHLKFFWKKISSCPMRCFLLICRGCLERRRNRNVNNLLLIQPVEEELDFEED
ncbi:hypothetical protein OS493_016876 [Desmophyllum pertusum]|uniref:Uncharacterized protein n=1 Tax=Desmophyllum pertusum TaxID=174260 RepID=A0A9X0CKM3_9CNID|nr:hypothetical protein OS493_016876 [Desmophyllum pertusum]